MGLFDYVTVRDPRFVCSCGHDLSAEEFQSKDFGCTMGRVLIEDGRLSSQAVYFGEPGTDNNKVEIYCTCRQCPAFVQFGTGNLVGFDVAFDVELSGATAAVTSTRRAWPGELRARRRSVKSIMRTSPALEFWLRDEPLERHMYRCEGPMPYEDARQLHSRYRELRVAQHTEFDVWATARARALQMGEPWPLSLRVGEYPDTGGGES